MPSKLKDLKSSRRTTNRKGFAVPRAATELSREVDFLIFGRFAKLAQGTGFKLPNPLLRDSLFSADLPESLLLLLQQAESALR